MPHKTQNLKWRGVVEVDFDIMDLLLKFLMFFHQYTHFCHQGVCVGKNVG
jgi:hypothetical protein